LRARWYLTLPVRSVSCAALKTAIATLAADEVASVDSAKVKELAEGWDKAATDLQVLINDCTRFLPPFDSKKAQTLLDAAISDIAAARAKAAPRQRFTFSKKATTSGASIAAAAQREQEALKEAKAAKAAAASTTASAVGLASSSSNHESNNPFAKSTSSSTSGSSKPKWEEDEHTIDGHSGKVIYMPLGAFTSSASASSESASSSASSAASVVQTCDLAHTESLSTLLSSSSASTSGAGTVTLPSLTIKGAKDLRLLNLTDCLVVLSDITRAIRIDNLTRCVVIAAGPTAGSVLLHNCKDCVFLLTSRQIRLHTSSNCVFFLTVQSRPIIEFCTGFYFAPNALSYPLLGHCLEVAGGLPSIHRQEPRYLTPEAVAGGNTHSTTTNPSEAATPASFVPGSVHMQWRSVDDFGWHRVQKSPNWDMLPKSMWPSSSSSLSEVATLPQRIKALKENKPASTTTAAASLEASGESSSGTAALSAAIEVVCSRLGLSCSYEGQGFEAILRSVEWLEAQQRSAKEAKEATEREEQTKKAQHHDHQQPGAAEAELVAAADTVKPTNEQTKAQAEAAIVAPVATRAGGAAADDAVVQSSKQQPHQSPTTSAAAPPVKVVVVTPAAASSASDGVPPSASAPNSSEGGGKVVTVASTITKVVLPVGPTAGATKAASAAPDDDDEL
jgi:Tubulin binding cofactor C